VYRNIFVKNYYFKLKILCFYLKLTTRVTITKESADYYLILTTRVTITKESVNYYLKLTTPVTIIKECANFRKPSKCYLVLFPDIYSKNADVSKTDFLHSIQNTPVEFGKYSVRSAPL
jgi:hypothetical protein